ncbi:hypothetical protein Clacol_008641 [Clathrus columnatus]|uniref:PPM-type phosphatase domain-containing protein n=1 Tax=Clathrus columnatus TaxID=1419009 RepID=A0AAV5AKU5_9AGAM|nr:hypothetical protein Clacol_008641 [Clathrus columnatus]
MSTKRFYAVIPRQSRGLSLYHVEPPPPPHPYARPSPASTSRHSGSGSGSNSGSGNLAQGEGSPTGSGSSSSPSSTPTPSSTNSGPQAQGQGQPQPQPQSQNGSSSSSSTHASAVLSPADSPGGQVAPAQPSSSSSSSSQVQALPFNQQYSLFPRLYTDLLVSPPYGLSGMAMKVLNGSSTKRTRAKMVYRLSAGAYGIPKRRASTLSRHVNANGTTAVPFVSPVPLSNPASMYPKPLNPNPNHTSTALPNLNSGISDSDSLNLATQVGEDAYFIRPDAMGVADGVGGWSRSPSAQEANSALFSRICGKEGNSQDKGKAKATPADPFFWDAFNPTVSASAIPQPLSSQSSRPPTSSVTSLPDINPLDILQRSYDRCIDSFKRQGLTGSATALLAILRDQELRVAHLGDCALAVVRDGDLLYRSEEMQHAFNYPLQLGPSSPTQPSQARLITIPVQEDDIVILSSDGMTDNLWDEDVIDEVRKFLRDAPDPSSSSSSALASAPFGTTLSTNEGQGTGATDKEKEKDIERERWRANLPVLLSKALCSRAKKVSESGRKDGFVHGSIKTLKSMRGAAPSGPSRVVVDKVVVQSTSTSATELVDITKPEPLPLDASQLEPISNTNLISEPASDSNLSSSPLSSSIKTPSLPPASIPTSALSSASTSVSISTSTSTSSSTSPSTSVPTSPLPSASIPTSKSHASNPSDSSRPASRPSSRLSFSPEDDEIPFARRAREEGVRFPGGGKCDDISVLVAVISSYPSESNETEFNTTSTGSLSKTAKNKFHLSFSASQNVFPSSHTGMIPIPTAIRAQLLMNMSMSSTSSVASSLASSFSTLHPSYQKLLLAFGVGAFLYWGWGAVLRSGAFGLG